jgi:hypothetical protein
MEPKLTLGIELEGPYANYSTLFVHDNVPLERIYDALATNKHVVHVYFGAGRRTYVEPHVVSILQQSRPKLRISVEYNGIQSPTFTDFACRFSIAARKKIMWMFPLVAFDNQMLNECETGSKYQRLRKSAKSAIEEGISFLIVTKDLQGCAKVETEDRVFVFPLTVSGASVCYWKEYDTDVDLPASGVRHETTN